MTNDKRNETLSVCTNCGGQLRIDAGTEVTECSYCGAQYGVADLLGESDVVRVEKIKSQAYKDVEAGKREVERERMRHELEKEKAQEDKDNVAAFKKGKFSKFLIICTIISAFVCVIELSGGISFAGIIALIQAGLYLTAWLMGMQIIKTKNKRVYILVAAISFVLIIPFMMTCGSSTSPAEKTEKIVWSDVEMNEHLPEPDSLVGKVNSNSETYISVYIHNTSQKDYKKYVDECIEKGFSIDASKTESNYSAFNSLGYKLSLWHDSNNEKMNISVEAPEEMRNFFWPTSGPATLIPATKSLWGNVSWNNSETYIAHIGKTPIDEYAEYVIACEEAGFVVDFSKGDDYYFANNEEGYELKLRYLGFDTIEVSIAAPENENDVSEEANETVEESPENENVEVEESEPEEELDETETEEPVVEETPGMVDGMRKEFKEAMDSYELFYDEYVDFMIKYQESDDVLSMMEDYLEMLEQAEDMSKKMEEWETADLNDIESAYFLQVQSRVNQKLLEIAQ